MLSHEGHRKRSKQRAAWMIESEAGKFVLEAVARIDLFNKLCFIDEVNGFDKWIRLRDVTQHSELANFPFEMEYWHGDPPEQRVPLKQLWPQLQNTILSGCIDQKPHDSARGLGVVTFWRGHKVVIHNRPELTVHRPINKLRVNHDTTIAMHWFEPFVADLAETCRGDIASEDAIIRLEDTWSHMDWEDFPSF